MRREVEQKIVSQFVDDALKEGYRLTVSLERGYDIDDCLLGSRDKQKILEEAFAGDECHIFVHNPTGPLIENGSLATIGWVYFVMGNDGYDVISDYTTRMEELLTKANKLADYYGG